MNCIRYSCAMLKQKNIRLIRFCTILYVTFLEENAEKTVLFEYFDIYFLCLFLFYSMNTLCCYSFFYLFIALTVVVRLQYLLFSHCWGHFYIFHLEELNISFYISIRRRLRNALMLFFSEILNTFFYIVLNQKIMYNIIRLNS